MLQKSVADADALLAHDLFATATRAEAARRWFAEEPVQPAHGAGVHAFALALDEAVDWTRFGLWLTMLLNRHGEKVLRVKGMLDVEGSATPVALGATRTLKTRTTGWWPRTRPFSAFSRARWS